VPLLREVAHILPVPIEGVISDGQRAIRKAVESTLPGVPHQLCQFHYLREAAKEVYEADRHAKKELKKHVRGVRPIERKLEGRNDHEAEAIRGYCLAARSAITDDGWPPLAASGLKLHERLSAIHGSVQRVRKRGTSRRASRGARAPAPTSGARASTDGSHVGRDTAVLLVGASGGTYPEKRRRSPGRGGAPGIPKTSLGDVYPQGRSRHLSGAVS
jgi:hypothetical protein